MADILDDLRERYEYGKREWQTSRKEAEIDMAFVNGDPWDADDKIQRKNRPTIAPEEMGQYFNQVINQLWANPRGMKFAPRGNGASAAGARFYQNKAREIEYRSHAKVGYITAASDAIQRSYGFVGIEARYASPRTRNQELWIVAKPDPDMILIDPEALSPDSSDMTWAFEEEWRDQSEFKRQFGKKAKILNFGDWTSRYPSWLTGNKVKVAKYWAITTTPRKLLLVQPPATTMAPPERMIAPSPQAMPQPIEVFEDEIPQGAKLLQQLRTVDYPKVRWYLTNGIEVLDEGEWLGKYIPLVSCYGKVLYVPSGGETKRVLLSMTRFGRAPWKAMCYADSSMIEVVSGIPKAPFMAAKGQFGGDLARIMQEAQYQPKAFVEYDPNPPGNNGPPLGPPQRPDFPAGQHLQALLEVSEHFRQRVQSAMGSNFLPTQAQKRNEKSGVALDKIQQAASTGTFHFVNNYEDMIRQVAVITEDLIDKYYDFAGETAVMEADQTARTIKINSQHPDAVSTKGDYLVTVSTAPSSDSEQEAVQDFTDTLVNGIAQIAQIAGQKPAAAILAKSIRMRNLGPQGDQLADLIEPAEYKAQDGQAPPNPELQALKAENQQLKGVLQQAATEKQSKVVEQQGKFAIAKLQEDAEDRRAAYDREKDLAVAELGAKMERRLLFLEERERIGAQVEAQRQRDHEMAMAAAQQGTAAETADRTHQQGMEMATHQAALEPPPAEDAGAGA